MPSNFKKLVRKRMSETGESWQTASRALRSRTPRVPVLHGDATQEGEPGFCIHGTPLTDVCPICEGA